MRAPPGKTTLRFLQRLSFDVLQRSFSPAERNAWLDAEVATVVPRLVQSREAMAAWFDEEIYYFLLLDNFRPRGEAIELVPARLQKGELTARDAIGELLLSTGFSLRNPGNDTFVTVVLEQCLGYRVQDQKTKPILAAGKKLYDGQKGRFLGAEGQNQADVVQIALRHPDFSKHLLARHRARLLGGAVDAAECARVHQDFRQFFPVLAQWLASDAYAAAAALKKPKTERQFLRGLYMDLLERAPTFDDLRLLRNAMQSMADPAPLRAVVAKVMLDSGQAKLPPCARGAEAAFVRDCFARYLAREPSPKETATFVTSLQQDGAQPVHVVRALVASLEYQLY
jgi:hypothetical protein